MWKTLLGAAGGASVWNQVDMGSGVVVSALGSVATVAGGAWRSVRATKGLRRGKWYWEVTIVTAATGASYVTVGVMNSTAALTSYTGGDANGWCYYSNDGNKITGASSVAYGTAYVRGDVIGVALDMNAGAIYFYKNGTIQNSGTAAYTGLTGTLYPAIGCLSTGSGNANFGQIPFAYAVPDGYNAGVI